MPEQGLAELVDAVNTRHLFFTGKGGVGKTSTACAVAIALADHGKRVLLVSTDPASNLDEVLETAIATTPTAITGVAGLDALNVDPEQAAAAYRERVIGPYRGILPDSAVARVEEQLSGACTVEIAAFDEFTALLTDDPITESYDHIVFDTAPTGHTLRLLALPAAWTGFIGDGTGTSCLGPLSGLQAQQARYAHAVQELSDPARTTLVLVARPDIASLSEAARTGHELRAIGIAAQRLVINGVFRATDGIEDPLAAAMDAQTTASLAALPKGLAALARTTVSLMSRSPIGIEGLRLFAERTEAAPSDAQTALPALANATAFTTVIDDIAAPGSGLVMTMGKGGVGKTTVACAVAVELAARGHRVTLTTTDPAAHIAGTIDTDVAGITIERIDPLAETAAYTAEVLATAGPDLDPDARAVLEEDLASPCTEEIAVFQAFARTVEQAQHGFVVLDTAPTGHTLLLLDAARSYHRELGRQAGQVPDHVAHLMDRLQDPVHTHVLLIALPEATPVHEAVRLQTDLQRSGISPAAWIVNQSLLAVHPTDPVLRARAGEEVRHLDEVASILTTRMVVLPKTAMAPTGAARLRNLVAPRESTTRHLDARQLA